MMKDNIQALHLISILSLCASAVFLIVSCLTPGYEHPSYRLANITTLMVSTMALILIRWYREQTDFSLRRFHICMFIYLLWMSVYGAVVSYFDSLNHGGLFMFLTCQVWIYDLVLIPPHLSVMMCGLTFLVFLGTTAVSLHFPPVQYVETALFYVTIVAANFFHYRNAYNKISQGEQILGDNYRLNKMSTTDELTEVRNRTGLKVDLEHMWSDTLYVMMCDIDHFKQYNDAYGHASGDMVLNKFAVALSDIFGNEHIYRYGGDEFLVIVSLPAVTEDTFRSRIRMASCHYRKMYFGKVENPTSSFGFVYGRCHSEDDLQAMIRAADAYLYQAKRNGRDQVRGGPFDTPDKAAGL